MENNQLILDKVLNLPIGHSMDWKPSFITRDVYRVSDTEFELTETADGWYNAKATIEQMKLLITGKMDVSELNWF
jgi:hypothetical protein